MSESRPQAGMQLVGTVTLETELAMRVNAVLAFPRDRRHVDDLRAACSSIPPARVAELSLHVRELWAAARSAVAAWPVDVEALHAASDLFLQRAQFLRHATPRPGLTRAAFDPAGIGGNGDDG